MNQNFIQNKKQQTVSHSIKSDDRANLVSFKDSKQDFDTFIS